MGHHDSIVNEGWRAGYIAYLGQGSCRRRCTCSSGSSFLRQLRGQRRKLIMRQGVDVDVGHFGKGRSKAINVGDGAVGGTGWAILRRCRLAIGLKL